MVVVRPRSRKADEIIAALAAKAHGVVTRRELVDAGITPGEIRHRLDSGSLRPVHPGVYRVGHDAPSVAATYLAAVRAGGYSAFLGGLAGAYNLGVLRGPAPPPEIVARGERRISGVTCRRMRGLQAGDTTVWNVIPTLTVAATLVDIAGRLDIGSLARACHEAGVRHRTTPRQTESVLGRRPNAPGASKLRAVMAGDAKVSLSRLESRFLELLRTAWLPLPVTNRPAGGRRVDCRWPVHRVTVELDSYGFHNSRLSWERDHAREREAYARGDAFRRYTWGDVFERPEAMLRELRELLGGGRPGSWSSSDRDPGQPPR